jgi:hypothetical protein
MVLGAGAAALAAVPARAATGIPAAVQMVFGDLRNGQFGADLRGLDFVGLQRPLNPEVFRGTSLEVRNAAPPNAARVILDNLPTVAAQGVPGSVGDPGSCEAESFGYCLGSYTVARKPNGDRKWSADDPANQPSCAWLYEWQHVHAGSQACPSGSGAVPYAQKLVATGAPSTQQFPYNPNNASKVGAICANLETYNTDTVGPDYARLMIGSYKGYSGLMNQQAQFLSTFKSLIRNGHAIAFTGLVPKAYCVEQPPLSNDAFTAPQGFITGSGHGQVIVGFDDSKGPNGAFLVQNSFGATWNPGPPNNKGHNGRIWYDYGAWFQGQSFGLIMYPNLDEPPAGTQLTASAGGAPELFVKEGKRYMDGGNAYLVLILHAKGPVTINQVSVTGPKGLKSSATLNEVLRFGTAYIKRKPEYLPGKYKAELTGKFGSGGEAVTWTGDVQIT